MTLGIVVYIEFPSGVARQDAQGRAQQIIRNLRAIAGPDDKYDVQPVVGRVLPGDRTTMQGLKRSHLDGLVRDAQRNQQPVPTPKPSRVPLTSVTFAPAPGFRTAYLIANRRVRFSPMEWRMLHLFAGRPGEWIATRDAVAVLWPGKETGPATTWASEFKNLYNRMNAKMHPHGEVLFQEQRGIRRWVGPELTEPEP